MTLDQQLRETLQSALDMRPVVAPEELIDRLTARAESAVEAAAPAEPDATGATGLSAAAWAGIAVAALVAGAVGLGLGVALSASSDSDSGITRGAGDDSTTVAEQLSSTVGDVPVFACPGADPLATLRHGDRVWITGATEDGAWVQVTSLRGDGGEVFIRVGDVSLDGSIDSLPVTDCRHAESPSPSPTPSTTPTIEPGQQPPDEPASTDTPESPAPAPPSDPEPAPEPEPAPDTASPVITSAASDDSVVDNSVTYCATPASTTVRVHATDNVEVTGGTIAFDAPNNAPVTTALTRSGGTWTAPFGPLAPDTTVGADVPVTVTVTVRDAAGNTASTTLTITVENCLS